MSRSAVVAVSQRVEIYPERNERRDALDQKLINFVLGAGFIPIPVPNGLCLVGLGVEETSPTLNSWLEQVKPDAILLSGGNDLGECEMRDQTEDCLLEYAASKFLPVLGICRGMQQIGVWSGAKVVKVEGHVRTRHKLQSVASVPGLPVDVNSFHRWSLADCPQDFEVLARSEYGEIEAIRHKKRQWEGWMWHPEREPVFSLVDVVRVKSLFKRNHNQ